MEIKRRRVGRPSISDETKKLVVRLYNENEMTCGEIAAACQISMSSLFRILKAQRKGVDRIWQEQRVDI